MSNIQGPPSNSQPPAAPANGGHATPNNPAQKKNAERDGDDFSQALSNRGERNGDRATPRGSAIPNSPTPQQAQAQAQPESMPRDMPELELDADGRVKPQAQDKKLEQPDNLENLLRQTYSKKKETREESVVIATTEAARTMDVQMNRTTEVQGVDNKAMIDKIEKIADRIMVSNAADVKAVKVDFKDSVLPGTEVVIRKDANGKINIEFTTTSSESMNFLSRGEQALTETLNRKLGGDITVDIRMQNADGEQDSGDGRSREQYVADDDDSDDRG